MAGKSRSLPAQPLPQLKDDASDAARDALSLAKGVSP
jgi:hypothetical protein